MSTLMTTTFLCRNEYSSRQNTPVRASGKQHPGGWKAPFEQLDNNTYHIGYQNLRGLPSNVL